MGFFHSWIYTTILQSCTDNSVNRKSIRNKKMLLLEQYLLQAELKTHERTSFVKSLRHITRSYYRHSDIAHFINHV